QRYLSGDQLTESDIKAFPVVLRLDPVAYGLFKCNAKRITDYPNLFGYLRELYQLPEFKSTADINLIKQGYYNDKSLNPLGIVPTGPTLDLMAPHGRDGLPGK
ncbi:glutathione S-transferase C-terminal domain-containing protein, partial [Salmonella sp. s54836]|uniref:glutathione S-transferase C-terminal domain-containing protein n=1 Tax=Salmonella sp. s54836 TaxID=3159673 RepID=UPI003980637A